MKNIRLVGLINSESFQMIRFALGVDTVWLCLIMYDFHDMIQVLQKRNPDFLQSTIEGLLELQWNLFVDEMKRVYKNHHFSTNVYTLLRCTGELFGTVLLYLMVTKLWVMLTNFYNGQQRRTTTRTLGKDLDLYNNTIACNVPA